MIDDVRLSIVLPTFQRASFLEKTLHKMREILSPGDELIVVDGGSQDDTRQVVGRFADLVTRFISEPDRGEAHALNKGVLASRGDYVKFMSDDDDLDVAAFRQARRLLAENPRIDALLCGGESYQVPATGAADGAAPLRLRAISLPAGATLRNNLWAVLFQANCGVGLFVSRRAIAWTGLLDPRFRAVDADYLARLATGGLDFRYAHLRLFRHFEYPHSGQRDTRRTIPEVLGILARHRRWDLMLRWGASAVTRRLLGRSLYATTYRGGDENWDGRLQ